MLSRAKYSRLHRSVCRFGWGSVETMPLIAVRFWWICGGSWKQNFLWQANIHFAAYYKKKKYRSGTSLPKLGEGSFPNLTPLPLNNAQFKFRRNQNDNIKWIERTGCEATVPARKFYLFTVMNCFSYTVQRSSIFGCTTTIEVMSMKNTQQKHRRQTNRRYPQRSARAYREVIELAGLRPQPS